MYAFPVTDQSPVISLFRFAVQEPRIPGKWKGDGSPIAQVND